MQFGLIISLSYLIPVVNILLHSATHAQPFAWVANMIFLLTKVSIDTIMCEVIMRPSKKELINKLKEAKKAVSEICSYSRPPMARISTR